MNFIKCPQCSEYQGRKTLRELRWMFDCSACGFTCYLKQLTTYANRPNT